MGREVAYTLDRPPVYTGHTNSERGEVNIEVGRTERSEGISLSHTDYTWMCTTHTHTHNQPWNTTHTVHYIIWANTHKQTFTTMTNVQSPWNLTPIYMFLDCGRKPVLHQYTQYNTLHIHWYINIALHYEQTFSQRTFLSQGFVLKLKGTDSYQRISCCFVHDPSLDPILQTSSKVHVCKRFLRC